MTWTHPVGDKKMAWNYRVIKRTYDNGWIHFGIHEVYYTKKGNPHSWTENRMAPCGETVDELKNDMIKMLDAFNKPVLDEEALEESVAKRKKGKKDA